MSAGRYRIFFHFLKSRVFVRKMQYFPFGEFKKKVIMGSFCKADFDAFSKGNFAVTSCGTMVYILD
jgi:hypothetical protein